ncbi:MAG: glycosyltransferase family 1 protein [Abditibacteriota bacterium]|nr:glycosyltransferase family 1 protein [Abditibacteriota bacterium]
MTEPIRILNAVGLMAPGGIETFIMNVYRNIDRSKVQFDFLYHRGLGGAYEDEIRSLGGRIYQMPVLKSGEKTYYWKIFAYISELKKFFNSHPEYHVLHGHMTNTASIYMPIAMKHGKVTCAIAHSHLSHARPGLSGTVTNLLQKSLSGISTDFFACSETAAEWIFSKEDIAAGKVRIVKNGVAPKRFCYDREKALEKKRELGLESKTVIGNVARFRAEKNHTFQIDVLAELVKTMPDTVLMLVGDGELQGEMEDKAKRLGLQNHVKFMGLRTDVPDLMLAMDVYFLPSLFEGLPVSAIEAQAAGLPVVTSTGVTPETDITGNVTFLELSQGPAVWASKVIEVCKSFERGDMTEYIRKNGYDITETARWLQEFYIKKHNGQ